MIKEAYCSYEVSKLLKEKGFEGECIAYYSRYKDNNLNLYRWRNRSTYVNVRNNDYTLVPTHQMAMKWLREVHNIFIVIEPYSNISCYFSFWQGNNYYEHPLRKGFPSYEETVEAALKYCLENLI